MGPYRDLIRLGRRLCRPARRKGPWQAQARSVHKSEQVPRRSESSGLIASTAVGAASFQGFGLGDWRMGLIAGAVISVAGQTGDLAESVLKRQAGVKDTGAVIPGHGGILTSIASTHCSMRSLPASLMASADSSD